MSKDELWDGTVPVWTRYRHAVAEERRTGHWPGLFTRDERRRIVEALPWPEERPGGESADGRHVTRTNYRKETKDE